MEDNKISKYFRSLIVGADAPVPLAGGGCRAAINFDNAATTPPFKAVMREINAFAPWYASIHRGAGYKSILSSDMFEQSRQIIKKFVNADSERDVVIYTKNTTEAINLLAYSLAKPENDQVVLSTDMEHLANDLPWQKKFRVDYVGIDEAGKLSLSSLREKLAWYQGKVKLVTVTGASNVTGYINPVYEIAKLAHKHGAQILVDGAQLVPHCQFDMKDYTLDEHIDYLVFSGHKMYAPFGGGVLIGPKETFENCEPVFKGGGIVRLVTRKFTIWDSPPFKDEAGTPNAMAAAAIAAAIKTFNYIGADYIYQYEHKLINYAIDGLRRIPGIKIYCSSKKNEKRVSLISFTIEDIHHKVLADILSAEAGIAVRSGLFCAHPYVIKLLKLSDKDVDYYYNNKIDRFPGLVRISLGLYNNYREIDTLLAVLTAIANKKSYYKQKYDDGRLNLPRRRLP